MIPILKVLIFLSFFSQSTVLAMKVTFNVECTPEEARAFLGLPDVAPMQKALMSEMENQLKQSMQAMTPEALFTTWLPASMQNVEQAQKVFWQQIQDNFSRLAESTTNAMISFADSADKR